MNLDLNQSKINAVKARMSQIETSELFKEEEKPRLLIKLQEELDQLEAVTPSEDK